MTVFYFNSLLQSYCNLFTKKIENHVDEVESNIKLIINSLTGSFETIKTQTESIISKLTSDISSLDYNHKNIWKFDKYKSRYEIAIQKQGHSHSDLVIIHNLFELTKRYRSKLKSAYPISNNDLKELKPKLESIKKNIEETISLIKDGGSKSIESRKINLQIEIIQYLKILINRLKGYIPSFQNLEKIGDDIRTIDYHKRRYSDKLDQEFCNSVKSLQNINIKKRQIHTLILTMNSQIKYIIPELQLLNSLLQYRDSIKTKLLPMKSVRFDKYNYSEFIKNSQSIIKTLGDIPKTIEDSMNEFNKIFNEIKTKEFYTKYHPEHLSPSFRIDISPIKSFIQNALQEIQVINFIIYSLQIIKLSSSPLIPIKRKIDEIKDIDSAMINLYEILKLLKIFYYINYNSIMIVYLFNFISYPVDYVNKFVYNLKIIFSYSEILIFVIKCYIIILDIINYVTGELNAIKEKVVELIPKSQEIKILSTHTLNIKKYLESINSSIKSLEKIKSHLNVKTFKSNISLIKNHIKQIYQNSQQIQVNINKIYKVMFELYRMLLEIVKIQTDIKDTIKGLLLFNDYLYGYIIIVLLISKRPEISEEKKLVFITQIDLIFKSIKNLQNIIKYLNSINKVIDDMKIKEFIEKIESLTKNIIKLVNKIESNTEETNKSILKLECAIEGVTRNFIRCSLQYLTDDIQVDNNKLFNVNRSKVY